MRLIAYLVLVAAFSSCQKRGEVLFSGERPDQVQLDGEVLPPEFDSFIDRMIEGTSEEDRLKIKEAATAEETYDHLGAGMALRNGELNRNDSKLRKALIRKGLFAPDDMSGIIFLSYARRIRGEPVKFEEQISDFRRFWASDDMVAPTDISCPRCKQEMEVGYSGPPPEPGWVKKYFHGVCPTGDDFWYYHADGWLTFEEVESNMGEQAVTPNGP
ncbi:MAG: DUF6794 domain-containing protein [Verrucomicrobiota bacterium]